MFMSGKKRKMMVVSCDGLMVVDGCLLRKLFTFSVMLTIKQRSQSKMRGDHLFYEEKIEMTQEERDAKAARRQVNLFKRRFWERH